jgi:hypothetical protein
MIRVVFGLWAGMAKTPGRYAAHWRQKRCMASLHLMANSHAYRRKNEMWHFLFASRARQHSSEKELADLTVALATIDMWKCLRLVGRG